MGINMMVEVTEIPKPSDLSKEIHFELDGLSYRLFITTNFLLPLNNGAYELNVYNDYYKVCGEVIKKHEHIHKSLHARFECPIFHKDNLEVEWSKSRDMIIREAKMLQDNQFTTISLPPNPIRLKE
jgi:hypothetical protein